MEKCFEQREKSHLLVVNSSHKMRHGEAFRYIYATKVEEDFRDLLPHVTLISLTAFFWQTNNTIFENKLIYVSKHNMTGEPGRYLFTKNEIFSFESKTFQIRYH